MPPTPVETAQVTVQTVSDRFDAVGSVEAEESIEVVSELSLPRQVVPVDQIERFNDYLDTIIGHVEIRFRVFEAPS